jgi:hypothetical protein
MYVPFEPFASKFLCLLWLLRARQSPCNLTILGRNLDCFGMAGVLDGKTRWRMRPCWYFFELLGLQQRPDRQSVSVVEPNERR